MAELGSSIFNQRASEKLRSPDDLDKYIRVTNPSVWMVLLACIALLFGLLAWGIFGSVSTSVPTTGGVVDGSAMCFLDSEEVAGVKVGDQVLFGNERMNVSRVARSPISRADAARMLESQPALGALLKDDWVYPVYFSGDTSGLIASAQYDVNITTQRVPPISLILNGGN